MDTMQETANKICLQIPEDWVITLNMESGSAWVELVNPDGEIVRLPDTTDKSLLEELNDALCVSKGFRI